MTQNERRLSQDNIEKSRKNIWGWIAVGFLLTTSAILLFLLFDTQYKLNFARGKFDVALDTISKKNEEIQSYQSGIETANSQVAELSTMINSQNSEIDLLNSKINSLNSDIDSLNSTIASLKNVKIVRVDVTNENCRNTYIFVNGRLSAGTRAGGTTYFYIPPGTYKIQQCSEPYRTNCGDEKARTLESSVEEVNVFRRSYCP